MDGGQVPGRRRDGVVVPTIVAALLGGVGVLAVALAGAWGFTAALSTSGSPGVAGAAAATASAPGVPASAPVVPATSHIGTVAVPPSPASQDGPVVLVEARTAPPPIQVTP
jgi:hypothetical protein